ncbi:DivIVA domain-containing protein [Alkaliphilus sp. MSJ-5]|uniref:DivIVA domain-containing protein n=1 Tax=Alkaliphilus flagellatus TaxID=2841507 RepID=A0ABS6G7F9_9FIRM|nr:DivIVA domain-containing protein [Alkaliphilus flagellatus]MBU5677341.1 DivIVA domain-containing protein [Alkaliphilus flagellatus]
MITPLEIQNKEFKRGIRGYKEDEVDEFLDQIMIDYEKLYKENIELKDKLEAAHHQMDQYKGIEETLKNTLIVAQNAAEDVRASAHKKSELIIQEAESKAGDIIAKAHREVEDIRNEFESTKKQMQIFKTRFRTLLQSQLDSLIESSDELVEENQDSQTA